MTIEEVKSIFRIFEQSFPDFIASEEKAKVWSVVLADVSFSDAKMATIEICRSDKRFPVPARLLEVIRNNKKQSSIEEPPESIWERLMKLAQRGDVGEEEFEAKESARTKKAVGSIGGFRHLRYGDLSSMPFVRRDFIAAYNEFVGYEQKKIANEQLKELVSNLAEMKLLK